MGLRQQYRGAIALLVGLFCSPLPSTAEPPARDEQPSEARQTDWLLETIQDAFEVAEGDVLHFRHDWGDVRIEAAETDRIHVTAIAQHHRDDPRAPMIRLVPGEKEHQLVVEFAHLAIAENEAWPKRRIDVGLTVPEGLELDVETSDGLIELDRARTMARLVSDRGDISYKGIASVFAHSERGKVVAMLYETGAGRRADLSTLTGDIRCILLEGARANVTLETRGTVTTDYSVEIEREPGSPLKRGRIRLGNDGTTIVLESQNGGIRLQAIIVPEGMPGEE